MRPALAALALSLVWLASHEREPVTPAADLPRPSPGVTLVRDLDALHLRALRAAEVIEADAALYDVGVHPVPRPRRFAR